MSGNTEHTANVADSSNVLICVACQTPNSADKKFCLKCGEGLTFACPECDASNPVDSGFCGSCGTDLRQIFRDGEAVFEQALAEAKKKVNELELTGAIRVLLTAIDSPVLILKSHKTQLQELVKQYRDEKTELKTDAAEKFKKAEYQYQQSNHSEAISILESIPAPIRSSEADELLRKLSGEFSEAKRLAGEIETLVKKKDLLGALPLIKSFLIIRPNDTKYVKLAADIVKRVVAKVESFKNEGKYNDAFQLIQRVGEVGQSSKTSELKREIKAVVWLVNYVKRAQAVDAGLVKALEKLQSITSTPENKKLYEEAASRLKSAAKNPLKPIGWSPIPKNPILGIPVSLAPARNLIEGFDGLTIEGRNSASFQIAAGLALQGIGKSEISTNLQDQKKSFFGFGGKRSGKTAWGLDLGFSSLKAIKLSIDGPQNIKVEHAAVFEYRNLDPLASNSDLRSTMLEALLRWKSKFEIKKDEILISNLNPNQVLGRYLLLPNADAKTMKSAMEFEVKLQIPFPLDDVVWDHYLFPELHQDKKLSLVVATRKKDAQLVEEMFSANGLKLAGLQSESVAIYNYNRLASQNSGAKSNEAYIDIGYTSSTVTFVNDSRIWFRSFGLGTNNFSKALGRALRLNSEQSNELLNHLPKAGDDIINALMAFEAPYDELRSEINRSLQGYEQESELKKPDQFICIGGGVKLHGLLTYLRHHPDHLKVE